ncbi:GIP [Symbiodinium natans]|uniref:GIP protein n=1 Tax=Symbiodinium natans TaxID=878477 RepID=A0A812N8L0_9DINO|nr:GIP [Symbiodinium natans]
MISKLEEHKLQQVDELRKRTQDGKDRIREARIALDKTWWDHLVEYARDGNLTAGGNGYAQAPFFSEVPEQALRGILPSEDVDSFWRALSEAFPNLNRRRRKAQPHNHKELLKLQSDGTVVVELDIARSSVHNLYSEPLWRLLVKAARDGRIAAVIGGPPCRTTSVLRHKPGGPRPARSPAEPYGLSDLSAAERELVDNDTGLFARMLFLHAAATAGRRVHRQSAEQSSQVAFLLEQPQPVDRYLPPAYASEAGLFEVDFD